MPNYSGIWTRTQQMQAIAAGLWTAPPGAPTIGTATAGNATASVTFTAPAYTGNPAGITSFTVTSSPSGITGTGASSPITVSGLANNTSYTFTVTATGSSGTGAASAASNSATPQAPPTVIGQAYGGGYYGGKIDISGTQYYLLVADKTVGEAYQKAWGLYNTSTGANSIIDGPANSALLAALGSAYEAATFCETLNTGGYTDWYLPARDELQVLYYFLKPGTDANDTASGSNAYAVSPQPVSTVYTAGDPAQTSATTFRTGASSQEFATLPSTGTYWTSTQYAPFSPQSYVWMQRSTTGAQPAQTKNSFSTMYTRAIRRVAV